MDKEKRYSVTDVAERLGVSAPTIRNWERDLDIEPMRMGSGMQRVYSQQDIDTYYKIMQLREEGVPFEQIKKFLAKFPVAHSLPTSTSSEIVVNKELYTLVQGAKEESNRVLYEYVQEAKEQIIGGVKDYVDKQVETISSNVRNEVVHAVRDEVGRAAIKLDRFNDERERRIEERDQALMQTLNALLDAKKTKQKRWWEFWK